jgi:hypothetical protein
MQIIEHNRPPGFLRRFTELANAFLAVAGVQLAFIHAEPRRIADQGGGDEPADQDGEPHCSDGMDRTRTHPKQ